MVRDAKFAGWGLDKPARPMFCVPLVQNVRYTKGGFQKLESASHRVRGTMLVTNTPAAQLEPMLKGTLADVDPDLTMLSLRTMREQISLSFDQERAVSSLADLSGILALGLAAVGLYGLTAYEVAQRTNEIGIRMALGADRARVIQLVLLGAPKNVALGLALGCRSPSAPDAWCQPDSMASPVGIRSR